MMKRIKNDNKGVSLIELLISMGIMGILAALVSVILVTGTRFFRKQSAVTNLHSDSHLITTSVTKAVLEGTQINYEKKVAGGVNYLELNTGDKIFAWVNDTGATNYGCLYVYGSTETVSFDKGHCLSTCVTYFDVFGKCLVETNSGLTTTIVSQEVSEANRIESVLVTVMLTNSLAQVDQDFEVKPRNTEVPFKKDID